MELERRLVEILLDTAVGSLNFGSGMLDDEEVSALREVARLLGVDPMEATPENFKCKYRGEHRTRHREGSVITGFDRAYTSCMDCGRVWYDDQVRDLSTITIEEM